MARQDEPDIRLKVGFFNHPKTLRVERDLGSDGVLCLIRLLMFARVNRHKDGALTGLTDEDIEASCGWHRCERYASGMLVASLSHAGYVDGEPGARKIHEWVQHQTFAANFTKRSKAGKKNATTRWDKTYGRPKSDANRMRVASEPHAIRYAPTPTPAPMAGGGGTEARPPAPTGAAVAPPEPYVAVPYVLPVADRDLAIAQRDAENERLARKGKPLRPDLRRHFGLPPLNGKAAP